MLSLLQIGNACRLLNCSSVAKMGKIDGSCKGIDDRTPYARTRNRGKHVHKDASERCLDKITSLLWWTGGPLRSNGLRGDDMISTCLSRR
jgi:hypothetical protein